MIITAYRIAKKFHAGSIWSGDGARDYGGRWNSKGIAVVYAAQSRSLAALEQLVHMIKPRALRGFVVASIKFDDRKLQRISPADLPEDWKEPVAPAALRRYGDEFVAAGTYPVLAVPSAVMPAEWNYMFNPAHPEFRHLPKSPAEPFHYDSRLK